VLHDAMHVICCLQSSEVGSTSINNDPSFFFILWTRKGIDPLVEFLKKYCATGTA
jgi:hypothetical protein